MMAVAIRTNPVFSAGSPKVLFESRHAVREFYADYDVTSDGKEFLMIEPESARDPDRLVVVLNWFEELKRKVPI